MTRSLQRFIFLACSVLIPSCAQAQSWNGWHPTAWGLHRWRTNDVAPTATVWAVTNRFTFTNHVGTNTIVSNVVFAETYTFQQLTNPVIRDFYAYGIASNGEPDAFYVSVTAMPYQTSITLQPREVRAFDTYLAIRERMRAITNNATVNATLYNFPPLFRGRSTVQTYGTLDGGQRQQLLWCKAWAANTNWTGEFLWQHMIPTNTADYEGWFSSNAVYSIPRYSNTADLIRNGATNLPANYLTHTPYRFLDCLNDGYGRVVTTRIYYVGSESVITSVNWCGDSVVVTNAAWTNGAFVEVKCTNANIQQAGPEYEAYTDEILGWCGMTNILNQLRYTTSGFCGNDGVPASDVKWKRAVYEDLLFCDSRAGMENGISQTWINETDSSCDGTTNTSSAAYSANTSCSFVDGGFWKYYHQSVSAASNAYFGEASGVSADYTVAVGSAATGITYHADLYVSCQTNFQTGATNFVFQYDDYGQSFTTNMTVFGSIDATGPSTNTIRVIDDPQNLPLPAAPTNSLSTGTLYIRGFSGARAFWVIDWTVDGGFKYK